MYAFGNASKTEFEEKEEMKKMKKRRRRRKKYFGLGEFVLENALQMFVFRSYF
jgi:hypothetical protein